MAVSDDGDRLLRRKGVAAMLGISRHTLARVIATDPAFPPFFQLTPGIECVRARDVSYWLAQKEFKARAAAQTWTT